MESTSLQQNRVGTLEKKADYLKPRLDNAVSASELKQRKLIPIFQFELPGFTLQEIFVEMGIPYEYYSKILDRIFFNPLIPIFQPNVLGGFHTQDKYIQVNPLILKQKNPKLKMAHVIFHEYTHMTGIFDEAITEMMTIKMMKQVYGRVGFMSGYVGIVNELEAALGDISYEKLNELMNNTHSNMLSSVLSEIVLKDVFDMPRSDNEFLENLRFDELLFSAKTKWNLILRLFPRLVNQLDTGQKDMFEDAVMDWYQVRKESIAEMMFERVFLNSKRAFRVLDAIFKKGGQEGFYTYPGFEYMYEYAIRNNIDLLRLYNGLKAQYQNQEG